MLRRRLGWWSARLLARWLPDLPAESIDDVARFGIRWASRLPARWVGPGGPLESVAEALWERGRYAEAVSYAERVVQMRRELRDRRGEGLALRYLGVAHWHAGDLDAALEWLESALAIFRDLGDRRSEEDVREDIGRLGRETQA